LLGLSQEKLGEALALTFQQVQKYENGSNRIGASRLYQISKVLDVPVSHFYEDMPKGLGRPSLPDAPQTQEHIDLDTMHSRETLELVRAYYRIDRSQVRDRLRETVRAIAVKRRRGRPPSVRS
jgi:transcriptional regulator with XRE-family HTH domain